MFTGIIQGIAEVVSIKEQINFCTHIIKMSKTLLFGLKPGSSVSYNGCCLTVKEIYEDFVSFDLMKETLYLTNLSKIQPGSIVNIERAVKFNDEIGGHLMSGHIMTTAEIFKIINTENNKEIWLRLKDKSLKKYIFYKGFIGVDGISLTIGKIVKTGFCVHLIPETIERTTLNSKKLGQLVNIEIDARIQAIVDTVESMLKQQVISLKNCINT